MHTSSENGSYIYIQTSSPRKYNEKARLNSPWLNGPLWMTFFYSMYGSTIETLSVYLRVNGSESKIWSRHGNSSSRDWIKGCVAISYDGTYQVVQQAKTIRCIVTPVCLCLCVRRFCSGSKNTTQSFGKMDPSAIYSSLEKAGRFSNQMHVQFSGV